MNINDGFYYYKAGFNDINFIIDSDLYLDAKNIPGAIDEVFKSEFIADSEISTVTFIEITNYCEEMCAGLP